MALTTNSGPTVVVEQPNYLPWLGYFDLVQQSDVWVWYDDVQYTRRDWRNRNRVAAGEPIWLTVPVTRPERGDLICQVEIDYREPWVRRHLETLRHCYARAPYFREVHALVQQLLDRRPVLLADLTIELNEALCELLGMRRVFHRSSLLGIPGSSKEQRLLAICEQLGASAYLSGPSARDYLVPQSFAERGLELRYILYDFSPYNRGRQPFLPQLSIVDALAWLGVEGTRRQLERGGRSESGLTSSVSAQP